MHTQAPATRMPMGGNEEDQIGSLCSAWDAPKRLFGLP